MKSWGWINQVWDFCLIFGCWFSQGSSSLEEDWHLEVHSTFFFSVIVPGRILWCNGLSRKGTPLLGLGTLMLASQWSPCGITQKRFPFHVPYYWLHITDRIHFTLHCLVLFRMHKEKESNGILGLGKMWKLILTILSLIFYLKVWILCVFPHQVNGNRLCIALTYLIIQAWLIGCQYKLYKLKSDINNLW